MELCRWRIFNGEADGNTRHPYADTRSTGSSRHSSTGSPLSRRPLLRQRRLGSHCFCREPWVEQSRGLRNDRLRGLQPSSSAPRSLHVARVAGGVRIPGSSCRIDFILLQKSPIPLHPSQSFQEYCILQVFILQTLLPLQSSSAAVMRPVSGLQTFSVLDACRQLLQSGAEIASASQATTRKGQQALNDGLLASSSSSIELHVMYNHDCCVATHAEYVLFLGRDIVFLAVIQCVQDIYFVSSF